MKMTLNNKQKQFLFDKGYVNSKCLDALTYKGWQNYFIDNFIWKLELNYNAFGFNELHLIDKDMKCISYEIMCNFDSEGIDLTTLANI